jgi:hypothetical protein
MPASRRRRGRQFNPAPRPRHGPADRERAPYARTR